MTFLKSLSLTLALVCGLALSGCGSPVDFVSIEQPRPTLNLPDPPPLVLEPVQWQALTTGGTTSYVLDQGNFEALNRNLDKTTSFIVIIRGTLGEYRRYYEAPPVPLAP
jgi:hypothetical protein